MRFPDSLIALLDHGVLEEVVRPLMSGKEAQVFLVVSGGEERVAKVYKEAQNRTFKNRAEYTEGRKVRNSRDQRAMGKRSRHGRAQDEAAWRSTEVDMIYRLRDAGVRVPTPYHFIDGVLIMELVRGADGHPAPRLGELVFSGEEATQVFDQLLAEVVRMLCAGVVHGDLSDFNVLMGPQGPVVIDFPQAVDASSNQSARKLLVRDVDNLRRFVERFAPARPHLSYAQEMWHLYERGELTPDTKLTGHYAAATKQAETGDVVSLIEDAQFDERRRRQTLGLSLRGTSGTPSPKRDGKPQFARRAGREAQPPSAARPGRQQAAAPRSDHGAARTGAPRPSQSAKHRQAQAATTRPAQTFRNAPGQAPSQPGAPTQKASQGAGATGPDSPAPPHKRRRRRRKPSQGAKPPQR